METTTKDERLAEVEKELETLGFCAANGSTEALALFYIACELRLIRRSMESGPLKDLANCVQYVYDHGPALSVSQVGR